MRRMMTKETIKTKWSRVKNMSKVMNKLPTRPSGGRGSSRSGLDCVLLQVRCDRHSHGK